MFNPIDRVIREGVSFHAYVRPLARFSIVIMIAGCGFRFDKASNQRNSDTMPMAASWQAISANVLKRSCVDCHNPQKKKNGIDLTTWQMVMKGGDDGVIVVPGKPDQSDLVDAVTSRMPPQGSGYTKVSAEEIQFICDWIKDGAKQTH